jgi:hypothetical protein
VLHAIAAGNGNEAKRLNQGLIYRPVSMDICLMVSEMLLKYYLVDESKIHEQHIQKKKIEMKKKQHIQTMTTYA